MRMAAAVVIKTNTEAGPACCALCWLDRVHCLYRDLGDGEIITLIDFNLRRLEGPGMTLEIFEETYCKNAKRALPAE